MDILIDTVQKPTLRVMKIITKYSKNAENNFRDKNKPKRQISIIDKSICGMYT